MSAMSLQERILPHTKKPSLNWAIAVSLAFHGLVLFFPRQSPKIEEHPARRIDATLVPRPSASLAASLPPAASPAPSMPSVPARTRSREKDLALKQPQEKPAQSAPQPAWTRGQKEDMQRFLRDLDGREKAGPDLAQRALAMARAAGRVATPPDHTGNRDGVDDLGSVTLERLPDSPPVDPFSLEMYLDGLVQKLNRSAAFVKREPRSRGMKNASMLIRLNPDGSLQSFNVLNAADQQDEIAFTRAVFEMAAPFPAFPPDIRKSARSLAMTVCILPVQSGGGGFGFTRIPDGRRC
jgi:hypothetical protein